MLADRVEREDIPIQDYSHSCFFITRGFLFREATMIKKEGSSPKYLIKKSNKNGHRMLFWIQYLHHQKPIQRRQNDVPDTA